MRDKVLELIRTFIHPDDVSYLDECLPYIPEGSEFTIDLGDNEPQFNVRVFNPTINVTESWFTGKDMPHPVVSIYVVSCRSVDGSHWCFSCKNKFTSVDHKALRETSRNLPCATFKGEVIDLVFIHELNGELVYENYFSEGDIEEAMKEGWTLGVIRGFTNRETGTLYRLTKPISAFKK